MDASPKGREIKALYGDAGTIVMRGNEITKLGERMITSAALLKDIADGASGQKGLAVEKLQEVIGDCHQELMLAGERYEPTGPVLVAYGSVVSEVQPLIFTAVQNCEADWATYKAKRNAVFDAQFALYPTPLAVEGSCDTDPADPRKEAVDDAQTVSDRAYGDWETEAGAFDRHYDTWEAAFDSAARDIGEATKGGIVDSPWDDADGYAAFALEILQWVGIVLAVVGIIVGGPFIALLAAIVAIATLVLTAYTFSRGNASVTDLVFAVIGVIPFGSLGKLKGNKAGFFNDMIGGPFPVKGNPSALMAEFRAFGSGFGGAAVAGRSGIQNFLGGVVEGVQGAAVHNGTGLGNTMTRLFMGKSADDLFNANTIGSADEGLDGLSIMFGTAQTQFNHIDRVIHVSDLMDSFRLDEPMWGSEKR